MAWSTVSNALAKSTKTLTVTLPASMDWVSSSTSFKRAKQRALTWLSGQLWCPPAELRYQVGCCTTSVSNANGTNWWDLDSAECFRLLNSAAASAADSATWIEWLRLLGARVSITVTYHVRHLPEDHGINVRPSGRSSVPGIRPVGSFTVGIPAPAKARHITSLIWLWRDAYARIDRPWRARSSTMAPQTYGAYIWGDQVSSQH